MQIPFHQPFNALEGAQGHTEEGPQSRAVGDTATDDRGQCAEPKLLDWKTTEGANPSAVHTRVLEEKRPVVPPDAVGDVGSHAQNTRCDRPVQRHPRLGKAGLDPAVPDPEIAQVELSAVADPLRVHGDEQTDENRLIGRRTDQVRHRSLVRLE